jgi:hypothetical protein
MRRYAIVALQQGGKVGCGSARSSPRIIGMDCTTEKLLISFNVLTEVCAAGRRREAASGGTQLCPALWNRSAATTFTRSAMPLD